MKKIIVTLGAVFMAASLQAAIVAWTSGVLYIPNASTGVYGALADTVAITGTITFYTFDGENYTEFTTTGITSTGTTKSGLLNGETGNNFEASTTYYANLYLLDPTGKWYLEDNSFVEVKVPASGPGAANFNFGTTGSWQPIPEPATLALLGIGVMAFGLRRRRK